MRAVALVTVLAIVEYLVLAFLCGQARARYKVQAPATTGDPMFERYFRVQQNTMEQLIVFFPSLWLFAMYVNPRAAAVLGLLFVIARAVYAYGYISEPKRRSAGAAITFLTNTVLALGSVVGVVVSMTR